MSLNDSQNRIGYTYFGRAGTGTLNCDIYTLLAFPKISPPSLPQVIPFREDQTPETYLGYLHASRYMGTPTLQPTQTVSYEAPSPLELHSWSLSGPWACEAQKIIAKGKASLTLRFQAKNVFFILGSKNGQTHQLKISLDGHPLSLGAGKDVSEGQLTVKDHALYELIHLPNSSEGILKLETTDPGLEFYAITFGS